MGGDYTRFTFTPRKNYSSVLKQQGRVRLDADENEQSEIEDRRWRAETQDIIGRCAVPRTTPDGFKIVATGAGTFDILVGRLYADGLLAENHGREPLQYDRSLGEMRGASPVPYDDQPYFPAPLPPVLPGTPGTTDLVFADVWQREVTAVEDAALLDVALGGVDTATRVQTIWQVRALQNVGAHHCLDAIPEWTQAIAPSPARLTTGAQPSVDPGDVCDVPTTGGFRGRENRLYRVEVHTGGTIAGGAATFKWSRDNASLTMTVEAIAGGTDLTLRRLGRDEVLRVRVDDWIEVLDDRVEFRRQAGHMARITRIDEAARTITVAPAVPAAFAFDPTDATRHTRVRAWHQRDGVNPATGLLAVTAGTIALEDGVEIAFSTDPKNGALVAGDYWVFAARTADGSVEQLQAAPPRGPVHHFCRLALITWGETPVATTVLDCRVLWPPRSCCTKVVASGEDIQEAIDTLPPAGGCVCLKVGVHTIEAPLRIARSNITVHGETRGAVLQRSGGAQLFAIGLDLPQNSTSGIRIESLTCQASGLNLRRDLFMIDAVNVRGLEIRSCDLLGPVNRPVIGAGIQILWSYNVTVADNRIINVVNGIQADFTGRLDVRGNLLLGVTTGGFATEAAAGDVAVLIGTNANAPCTVAENYAQGFDRGILAQTDVSCVIAQNEIHRSMRTAQEPIGEAAWGIDATGPHTVVADNLIDLVADRHGGIRVAGRQLRVEGNEIEVNVRRGELPPRAGILVDAPVTSLQSDGCVVRGNHVGDTLTAIEVRGGRGTRARGTFVIDNVIELQREDDVPRMGIKITDADDTDVSRNLVRGGNGALWLERGARNRAAGNSFLDTKAGALLRRQGGAAFLANRLDRLEDGGVFAIDSGNLTIADNEIFVTGESATGIFTFTTANARADVRVIRNHVGGGSMGIATARQGTVDVSDNVVEGASQKGIVDYVSERVTLSRNRVESCGFVATEDDTIVAISGNAVDERKTSYGIVVVGTVDRLIIEHCVVVNTGRSPGGQLTPDHTVGIAALTVRRAYIRANVIDGLLEGSDKQSHFAIRAVGAVVGVLPIGLGVVSAALEVQVVDNAASGWARRIVDVPPALVLVFGRLVALNRFGTGVCANNCCRQIVSPADAVPWDATMVFAARRISAVDNSVQANNRLVSFNFAGSRYITATSNITAGEWSNDLQGTWTAIINQLKPGPADQFNHIGVT